MTSVSLQHVPSLEPFKLQLIYISVLIYFKSGNTNQTIFSFNSIKDTYNLVK
jgi:hypothetical protein